MSDTVKEEGKEEMTDVVFILRRKSPLQCIQSTLTVNCISNVDIASLSI